MLPAKALADILPGISDVTAERRRRAMSFAQ